MQPCRRIYYYYLVYVLCGAVIWYMSFAVRLFGICPLRCVRGVCMYTICAYKGGRLRKQRRQFISWPTSSIRWLKNNFSAWESPNLVGLYKTFYSCFALLLLVRLYFIPFEPKRFYISSHFSSRTCPCISYRRWRFFQAGCQKKNNFDISDRTNHWKRDKLDVFLVESAWRYYINNETTSEKYFVF